MRNRLLLSLCVILGAAFCLAGCKSPNLQDRLNDGAQILRLNVGVGPGFLVNVHVGRPIAFGVGAYDARRYGIRNGHGWVWDERRYDSNLLIPVWGWEDVDAVLYGAMPVSLVRGDAHDTAPPGKSTGLCPRGRMPLTINDPHRGWFEISANAHLIFVGLDFGLDLGEFVDWAVGWFGLDPAGDDAHTGVELEKHSPPPASPPANPLVPAPTS